MNDQDEILQEDETSRQVEPAEGAEDVHKVRHLSGLYESWFLDYASYVILERAVPDVYDGLKPVQRRLLHAMKELDDGRYNKVANIIGHTMKYHPHGDVSIGDALVQMGQKELLIDTQGNWGNILTGDSAAAPRYIEARLSRFALEVVYSPKITAWRASYDGRNREPVTLPVKFPLLLAMGVEGIAVGLASKILPHNFNELLEASVHILEGNDFTLYPDFPTGGSADFSKYNDGLRGGKVRIRARIIQQDKRTLVITELPFGITTSSLIETIIAANDKGKIKIRKIDDNTAGQVEIVVHLAPGVSPDTTMDALYAFTDCEISVSPNACVILNGKPRFLDVKEILRISTDNTIKILKKELHVRKLELQEELLFSSLEKIFIEKRIYRKIEECQTWEAVIETIDQSLNPYKKKFFRPITTEDIIRLTEIKIKRISKFNSLKADEVIRELAFELEEVENHLEHVIEFAINYFRQIQKKYGASRTRKTEIRNFDTIEAAMVAAATQKLYVNREQGFAGTGLKKDEFVCDCSDIDDMIVFRADGNFIVTKVLEKSYVGENIIHVDIFKKNDDRTIYNLVYQDGKHGSVFVKRFPVVGIVRDKEYLITRGNAGSKILYFSANPNGEAEVIKVYFKPKPKMKVLSMDFDFGQVSIKGRNTQGRLLTHKGVRKVVKGEEGVSTLGAIDVWYDDTVRRLNYDGRGEHLGAFAGEDKIITILQSGCYRINGFELSTHFEEDMICIRKYDPEEVITAVYLEAESGAPYLKRFQAELSVKKVNFIGEDPKAQLIAVSFGVIPQVEIVFVPNPRRKTGSEIVSTAEFIGVKSYRARGKRLTTFPHEAIRFLEPETPAGTPENDSPETNDDYTSGENLLAEDAAEETQTEEEIRPQDSGEQETVEDDMTVEEIDEQEDVPGENPEPEKNGKKGKEGGYGQMELEF
ncbi:MAG: DNA gyrase/topoisomerase IV subunit A [Bacteroidales bacterium]|nr:DNA gyrase/topoisomerase IV subunit A [Bacteroidales bacterium]